MTDIIDRRVTRRGFGKMAGCALTSLALGDACMIANEPAAGADGRLTSRPRSGVATSAKSGALELATGRDAILQLPSVLSDGPLPLLLLLHGANGTGAGMLRRVGSAADEAGIAVLAPDSRGATWDAI